jgi:hypothetical protein
MRRSGFRCLPVLLTTPMPLANVSDDKQGHDRSHGLPRRHEQPPDQQCRCGPYQTAEDRQSMSASRA